MDVRLTLLDLPRHVLVLDVLLSHCSGVDVRALSCTSSWYFEALKGEDVLWKTLFETRGSRYPRPHPRFPTCGTWREVYLRSIHFQTLVVVHTLTRPDKELRLILTKTTPLYGLKREIRESQKMLDGVALEDFELVDVATGQRLQVAGNDSLPPADLRRLFWMDRAASHALQLASSGLVPRDGWRTNLTTLPDGVVLKQVFLDENGLHRCDDAAGIIESLLRGQSNRLECHNSVRELDDIVCNFQAQSGPTTYKTFWHSTFHPLITMAITLENREARLTALYLFLGHLFRSVCRPRFLMDVLVRSLLTDGFLASFSRLCYYIFPMVWETQIKQMLDPDLSTFDFVFAFKLIYNVFHSMSRAFVPMLRSALVVELVRALYRLVFTWESSLETLLVNLAAILVRPAHLSHTVTYLFSSLLWQLFDTKSESSLSVSLPLYFYAFPIITCALVLRIRVFIAQSYVSLLLV